MSKSLASSESTRARAARTPPAAGSRCGARTKLYVRGVPTCVHCDDLQEKRAKSATAERFLLKKQGTQDRCTACHAEPFRSLRSTDQLGDSDPGARPVSATRPNEDKYLGLATLDHPQKVNDSIDIEKALKMRFGWVNDPQARERLRAELTSAVEQHRADHHRLKGAGREISRRELAEARSAFEQALVCLSRFFEKAAQKPLPGDPTFNRRSSIVPVDVNRATTCGYLFHAKP